MIVGFTAQIVHQCISIYRMGRQHRRAQEERAAMHRENRLLLQTIARSFHPEPKQNVKQITEKVSE